MNIFKLGLFLLVGIFLFPMMLMAEPVKGKKSFNSFKDAKKADSRLEFVIESTKVGIFSSDVDGYVKEFSYEADYDKKNGIIRNMKISFHANKMDTDSEGRNEKLHKLCMSYDKFKIVTVQVPGPVFVKSARKAKMQGTVEIRGKKKKFTIELSVTEKSGKLHVEGTSVWGFKAMEIPDPSIAVAKVSEAIKVHIQLKI
jgi:polyisoprenoid-binding protein YceI